MASSIALLLFLIIGIIFLDFSYLKNSILKIKGTLLNISTRKIGLFLLSFALLLPLLCSFFTSTSFFIAPSTDDLSTYLYYIESLNQVHRLPLDPFSAQRIYFSPGAFSLLQLIPYNFLGRDNLHFTDAAFGIALLILLAKDFLHIKNIDYKFLPVCLFLLTIYPAPYNSQSFYISSSFFLCLLITLHYLFKKNNIVLSDTFVIALPASVLFVVKSTMTATTFTVMILSALYLFLQNRKNLKLIILTAFISLAFISPWLISLYLSSETFLFPVLGNGTLHDEGKQIFNFASPMAIVYLFMNFMNNKMFIFYFFSLALLYLFHLNREKLKKDPLIFILPVATLSGIIMIIKTSSEYPVIYTIPFFSVSYTWMLLSILKRKMDQKEIYSILLLTIFLMTIVNIFGPRVYQFGFLTAGIIFILYGSLAFTLKLRILLISSCSAILIFLATFFKQEFIVKSYWFFFLALIFVIICKFKKQSPLQLKVMPYVSILFIALLVNESLPLTFQANHFKFFEVQPSTYHKRLQPIYEYQTKLNKMQQSLPAGEPVLATIGYPFLLNQRRNRIFNQVSPGKASPKKTMPLFSDANTLKEFILSNGISIVLISKTHWYTYIRQDIFKKGTAEYEDREKYLQYIKQIKKLSNHCEILYQDDEFLALRLT